MVLGRQGNRFVDYLGQCHMDLVGFITVIIYILFLSLDFSH